MKSNLLIVVVLCVALVAAGAARALVDNRRQAMAPNSTVLGGAAEETSLGQLNSFALGLLLGGLRGPLVMALWSSSEQQRTERDLEDFDTRVELIRLLQPQFDTVHLYQIWNKAYNVSVEMANLASKYAAILDAVDYGQRVLTERPANIDLESQLGTIYNNKLAGSQESPYYRLRIHEETKADQPVVKITFPANRETEFRQAALEAGISPRRVQVRKTEVPTRLVAALRLDDAGRLRPLFAGEDTEFQQMAPRQIGARGVSGPLRLEPMLDDEGYLLPELIDPRREPPPGAEPATYLDGSPLQFLKRFEPFPEGVSPNALAYNHFMKAWVLQEYGGQRHVQHSETFINANPGRALRDWAYSAFEEGRLLEAEAFGATPVPPGTSGELQAELERASADIAPDADPLSSLLFEQAMQQYERGIEVAAVAQDWIERHLERYPGDQVTFSTSLARLEDLQALLEADLLYARLVAGEVSDREAAIRDAKDLYLKAHRQLLDFLMRHHVPAHLLPQGIQPYELPGQPIWMKWQVLDALRRERDARPLEFEHARTLAEFDGYFDRITTRLSHLRAAS